MNNQLSETITNNKLSLYDQDFYLWLETTVKLLQERRLDELDFDNLIEEIDAIGRNEKHALQNNLQIIFMHLLKYQYQPQKQSNRWRYPLLEHRYRLGITLKDSPSLKVYFQQIFAECYTKVCKIVALELELSLDSFPEKPPFTPEEILDIDYLPEA
jgi:hypothetical protein